MQRWANLQIVGNFAAAQGSVKKDSGDLENLGHLHVIYFSPVPQTLHSRGTTASCNITLGYATSLSCSLCVESADTLYSFLVSTNYM